MTTQPSSSNFEQMSARLEEIVRQLEQGEVPLDDSIKLFEEASELAKKCRKALDTAQLRVTELQKALAQDDQHDTSQDQDEEPPDQPNGKML